ncbi:MAG: hypothetical protein AAGF46_11105, partial [Pseudomonadota bacterium]
GFKIQFLYGSVGSSPTPGTNEKPDLSAYAEAGLFACRDLVMARPASRRICHMRETSPAFADTKRNTSYPPSHDK